MSFNPLSNLNIRGRLALSSLAFALPIAVLVVFMVQGRNDDIRFSQFEIYGNAYQRPLMRVLKLGAEHRRLALRAVYGEGEAAPARALEAPMAAALDELDVQQAANGQRLQFTDEGLAKRGREGLVPARLREDWQTARNFGDMKGGEVKAAHDALTRDVRAMIGHVGDTSNLILDPNLDSYYLMDVTLLSLPEAVDRLAQITAYGEEALEDMMVMEDERMQFTLYAAQLQGDIERVEASTHTALTEDANFHGQSESLARIKTPFADYEKASRDLLALVMKLTEPYATDIPEAAVFAKAGLRAADAAAEYWTAASEELDALLTVRVEHEREGRLWMLVFTVLSLALALVLVVLIGRSIARPIREIGAYTRRIAGEDFGASLENTYFGELEELSTDIRTMLATLKRLGFAQGLLEGLTYPCAVVDNDERLTFVNQALLDLMQIEGRPGDQLGQELGQFFYGEAGRKTTAGEAITTRRPCIGVELAVKTRKGGERIIRLDAAPLMDLEGEYIGAFDIISDITEIRANEARVSEQYATMSEVARQAGEIAQQVSTAAGQLSNQVDQVTEGTATQQQRTTETATAMTEMNATVLEVARNAAEAADQAGEARQSAQDGAEVVEQAITAIREVQEHTQTLRSSMEDLGRQAEGIGAIMGVISDIADQTNLLALNAAIEAARAGDAGRGFAVVADEVRKLAEKTMAATSEVGAAVSSIQDSARSNIEATESAARSVTLSTDLAGRSGEALTAIVATIDANAEQIRSIAVAAEEQSASTDEISRSVDGINEVCEVTAMGVGQSKDAIAELTQQAERLQELIRGMHSSSDT